MYGPYLKGGPVVNGKGRGERREMVMKEVEQKKEMSAILGRASP